MTEKICIRRDKAPSRGYYFCRENVDSSMQSHGGRTVSAKLSEGRGFSMKKKIVSLLAVACAGALALGGLTACGGGSSNNGGGSAAPAADQVSDDLQFVTGGESGTYYAFGTVLANYCTNNGGTSVTALSGNGSQANIQALQDGDANLAFCQSDVLAYAYEGTNLFEKDGAYKDFSIVGALYQEQVQIVTTNPDIKSVADLKGSVATSQLNTIWYDQIDQVPDVKKLPAIDTVPGMIVALKSGKCNLIVTDIPTAKAAAFANPELVMVEFPEGKGFKTSREDVEIGIAVKKGNKELTDAMNKVLGSMTEADFNKIMDEAIKKQPLAK